MASKKLLIITFFNILIMLSVIEITTAQKKINDSILFNDIKRLIYEDNLDQKFKIYDKIINQTIDLDLLGTAEKFIWEKKTVADINQLDKLSNELMIDASNLMVIRGNHKRAWIFLKTLNLDSLSKNFAPVYLSLNQIVLHLKFKEINENHMIGFDKILKLKQENKKYPWRLPIIHILELYALPNNTEKFDESQYSKSIQLLSAYCFYGQYEKVIEWFETNKVNTKYNDHQLIKAFAYYNLNQENSATEIIQAIKTNSDLSFQNQISISLLESFGAKNKRNQEIVYRDYKEYLNEYFSLYLKNKMSNDDEDYLLQQINNRMDYYKKEKRAAEDQQILLLSEKKKILEINRLIIISSIIIILAFVFIAYKTIRDLRTEKKLKMEAQKKHLIIQKETKTTSLSQQAALKIQETLLPNKKDLQFFLSHFERIYFPINDVSGDFYYALRKQEKNKDVLYFCSVDCTGSDIQGAFISIIVNSILNKELGNTTNENFNTVLNRVEKSFNIQFKENSNKFYPSFSIGLIQLTKYHDIEIMDVKYQGAKIDLHLFNHKTNNYQFIKSTRRSIGGKQNKKNEFHTFETKICKRDRILLATNGLFSQFNEDGVKFKQKGLKDFLSLNFGLPTNSLTFKLQKEFLDFKKSEKLIDDVLVTILEI